MDEMTEPPSAMTPLSVVVSNVTRFWTTATSASSASGSVNNTSDVWGDYAFSLDDTIFSGGVSGDGPAAVLPDYDESAYNDDGNTTASYLMPWPERTAWIGIFTLMLFVATVGNALVAWIVLGTIQAQSPMSTAPYVTLCLLSLIQLTDG